MKRVMWIAVGFWTVSAGTAWPIDQVFTSTSERAHFGKIINTTATVISFEPQRKDGPSEIPANEVTRIIFENSPDGLISAQVAMNRGDYEKAIEALKKETPEDKRREVGKEIVFCRASARPSWHFPEQPTRRKRACRCTSSSRTVPTVSTT